MRRSTRCRTAHPGRVEALLVAALAASPVVGCGLAVQAPDLFAVTRTGQGKPLTMLVNYDGGVSCDRGPTEILPDRLLIVARSLTGQLYPDAKKKLDPPSPPKSVYRFKVSVQEGTFSFPDSSAVHRPELAKLEQFVLQAEPICGVGG